MKILFLDIDGVVNTFYWLGNGAERKLYVNTTGTDDPPFNNTRGVKWISHFCEQRGYDIVITSTWRKGFSSEQIKDMLVSSGLDPSIRVIGSTPCLENRDEEILSYVRNVECTLDRFIVVDDDWCEGYAESELYPRWVRVNPRDGFVPSTYDRLVLLDEIDDFIQKARNFKREIEEKFPRLKADVTTRPRSFMEESIPDHIIEVKYSPKELLPEEEGFIVKRVGELFYDKGFYDIEVTPKEDQGIV